MERGCRTPSIRGPAPPPGRGTSRPRSGTPPCSAADRPGHGPDPFAPPGRGPGSAESADPERQSRQTESAKGSRPEAPKAPDPERGGGTTLDGSSSLPHRTGGTTGCRKGDFCSMPRVRGRSPRPVAGSKGPGPELGGGSRFDGPDRLQCSRCLRSQIQRGRPLPPGEQATVRGPALVRGEREPRAGRGRPTWAFSRQTAIAGGTAAVDPAVG